MVKQDYLVTIAELNKLQSGYRKLEETRKRIYSLSAEERKDYWSDRLDDFRKCLCTIGLTVEDLNGLNVIHVAGTNGKGSTCAYIQQLLLFCRNNLGWPCKIALYTSPHLTSVRERFRINGVAISEDSFARYFFEVHNALKNADVLPTYFRFLTLLMFHMAVKEHVDAIIIETGVGGEFDCTNIVHKPIVTVITRIGMDHRLALGPTLEDIAWHKAGIFKQGCAAITTRQDPSVEDVLKRRANEKKVELRTVDTDPRLLDLNIAPEQKRNASIALLATETFLSMMGKAYDLPPECILSLEKTKWAGRFDVRTECNIDWCIDGAHNDEALVVATKWFSRFVATRKPSPVLVLIFNQESPRDTVYLLRILHRELCQNYSLRLDHVIFCTNSVYANGNDPVELIDYNKNAEATALLKSQQRNADLWKELDCTAEVVVQNTIKEAIDCARSIGLGSQRATVLIIGSLRLVGGALYILDSHPSPLVANNPSRSQQRPGTD